MCVCCVVCCTWSSSVVDMGASSVPPVRLNASKSSVMSFMPRHSTLVLLYSSGFCFAATLRSFFSASLSTYTVNLMGCGFVLARIPELKRRKESLV